MSNELTHPTIPHEQTRTELVRTFSSIRTVGELRAWLYEQPSVSLALCFGSAITALSAPCAPGPNQPANPEYLARRMQCWNGEPIAEKMLLSIGLLEAIEHWMRKEMNEMPGAPQILLLAKRLDEPSHPTVSMVLEVLRQQISERMREPLQTSEAFAEDPFRIRWYGYAGKGYAKSFPGEDTSAEDLPAPEDPEDSLRKSKE